MNGTRRIAFHCSKCPVPEQFPNFYPLSAYCWPLKVICTNNTSDLRCIITLDNDMDKSQVRAVSLRRRVHLSDAA